VIAQHVRQRRRDGQRSPAGVRLRLPDVDPNAATIRWTRALGKVPGGTIEKETKTGVRWPVSLDTATVELFRSHRRRCLGSAFAAGGAVPDDAYVFARDPMGRLPWLPDGASQRFAAMRKRLELDGVRLHDVRHWMATEGLGGGADSETVAGCGGWANTLVLNPRSSSTQVATKGRHSRARLRSHRSVQPSQSGTPLFLFAKSVYSSNY
jgi:integrase